MSKFKIFKSLYRKKQKKYDLQKIFLWLAASSLSLLLFGILSATAIIIVLSQNLPKAEEIKNINFNESTDIYDRKGKLLYSIHGEENRDVVPINEISPHLIHATVAMEDQNFYNHHGFYPKRIIGSVYYKTKAYVTGSNQRLAGGSTITQQFVKNAFLTSERKLSRKIKELILAIRVERNYNKNQILEMYLNKIPYGNNAYGVQRASQIYFNKPAKDLTIAESAILASLPQGPSRYNPYGQHRYSLVVKEFTDEELEQRKITEEKDLKSDEYSRGLIGKVVQLNDKYKVYIKGRSDLVLREMLDQNYITKEEKQQAWEETQKIEFYPYKEKIKAPHFVIYVKQLLEEQFGKEIVEKGGLSVYTTLDLDIQEMAQKTVEEKGEFNAKQYGASNSALLAVQPKTGQILAMVGSRDYYNEEIDGNVNIVLRERQPGSSFKPIVYAQAFRKKHSPAQIIYDIKTNFGKDWEPKNFDGRYEGPMTIRRALAQSRNIPAIKMFYLAGGQKEIIDLAEKMGINTLDRERAYGPTLALGSGEVTMLELTQSYSVFANNGIKKDITPFLKIVDSENKVLHKWDENTNKEEVLNPQVAFLINSILSDKKVRLGPKIDIPDRDNAAKTGTSTKKDDEPNNGWTFNYTPNIVVAAWTGNNNGDALKSHASGYDGAAPIAKEFMTDLFKSRPKEFPAEKFSISEGIERITVSSATGKLPGPLNPPDKLITDYFAGFVKPLEMDNSFVKAKIYSPTGELASEFTPKYLIEEKIFQTHHSIDPSYVKWEEAVLAWAYANQEWSNQLPNKTESLHNEKTFMDTPTVTIMNPSPNQRVKPGLLRVEIYPEAKHGVDRTEFYLNDKLQYTSKDSPYDGSVRIPVNADDGDKFKIKVVVYDTLQYRVETSITVYVKSSSNNDSDAENTIDENNEDNSNNNDSEDSRIIERDGIFNRRD